MNNMAQAKMDVYREILFAGFPQQTQGGSFPSTYVESFFGHYGEVQHFVFDADRGIGSVTFAQGEVAMNCYLAVHLSLLPSRPNGSGTDDMRDGANTCLIFMEFAQCVPCVNPYLLRNGELSRHLMRYKTRMSSSQAAAPSLSTCSVANHFVVTWHKATETDLDSNPKRRIVRDGPHFPAADTSAAGSALVKRRNDAIAEAVWSLLRPEKRSPTDGDAVTVLDLWWEYYQRYVLHKTEPAEGRIKDPYFLFAHKPTVAQEIRRAFMSSQIGGSGDVQEDTIVVKRLIHDDVYHSVCNYIGMKLRFCNDPSWASLARDVASAGTAVGPGAQWEELEHNRSSNKKGDGDDDEMGTEEDIKALLRLPLLKAAANLMENVRFLQRVRRGEITVDNKPAHPKENANSRSMNYPTSTHREEGEFYMEVLSTLDSYSPTGTATSLMAMCEDPHTFRYVEGHIGWCELRGTKRSTWWVTCQAVMVVILIFVFAGWVLSLATSWMGVSWNVSNKPNAAPSRYEMNNSIDGKINIRFAEL
ncbi:hypothetical protein MOQ_005537 [Trypanosoma cruzi marinkellei]|uniref:Uncharacterized protein n=1 Tax=Trypanosoma cruzi marinkellei TaxID=85056 RepID=K2MXY6_TRYCR|nr:hypothetical protein MOQ_005537 [Trypanosoma cruzi marinkellei]